MTILLEDSGVIFEGTCPYFAANEGVSALHALTDYVTSAEVRSGVTSEEEGYMMEQLRDVLTLCVALWGDLPQLQFEAENTYRLGCLFIPSIF